MTSKIDDLSVEAEALLALCRKKGLHIATAESCTGGLIAAILTEIAGSSDVFDRGFVTYSNEAKADMLGVSPDLILKVGAVSEQVAEAMATGALARSLADLAISVTGVAGPGGGSPQKPVGMVCISLARRGQSPHVMTCQFGDVGRAAVRFATVKKAFALLQEEAEKH